MALIDCPECGHQVSDQADACPSCGRRLRRRLAELELEAELNRIDLEWEPVHGGFAHYGTASRV
jgi:predicted metal-binding protein